MAIKNFYLPGGQASVLADPAAVAVAAATVIRSAARAAIAARGAFRCCLAGGSTPTAAYGLLAEAAEDLAAPWSAWHLWYGDERCLPADHPDRNSRIVRAAWLARVPIPATQVHDIPAELGPEAAAAAYGQTLVGTPLFDLVLLGVGEDGHTASLFPGHPWAGDDRLVLPVQDAPKPPPQRVSLSPRALVDCRALLVLVTGAAKGAAVRDWQAGAPLPIAQVLAGLVQPAQVLLDAAAAA